MHKQQQPGGVLCAERLVPLPAAHAAKSSSVKTRVLQSPPQESCTAQLDLCSSMQWPSNLAGDYSAKQPRKGGSRLSSSGLSTSTLDMAFVIGAQKGGTTLLYDMLAQHPEVRLNSIFTFKHTVFTSFSMMFRQSPDFIFTTPDVFFYLPPANPSL